MTTFSTMVDGLKNAYWQPIRLADVSETYNAGSVNSVVDTGGLWAVDMKAGVPDPAWAFTFAPPSVAWAAFFRFTEFTHPTNADDIAVLLGLQDNGLGTVARGAGYQYPTGTANLNGGSYDTDVGFGGPGPVARAGVTLVGAGVMLNSNGGATQGVVYSPATGTGETVFAGGGMLASDRIVIQLGPSAGNAEVVGFRPEYAVIDLTKF